MWSFFSPSCPQSNAHSLLQCEGRTAGSISQRCRWPAAGPPINIMQVCGAALPCVSPQLRSITPTDCAPPRSFSPTFALWGIIVWVIFLHHYHIPPLQEKKNAEIQFSQWPIIAAVRWGWWGSHRVTAPVFKDTDWNESNRMTLIWILNGKNKIDGYI